MGIITGGNVIQGHAIPGSYARVTYVEAVPTDANVGGSSGRAVRHVRPRMGSSRRTC
jgi:hypothetical protein